MYHMLGNHRRFQGNMPNNSLPSSHSTTSLASSFSSSAASSMLHAAHPSNSSESDFMASDHSTSSSPSKASSPVHTSVRALPLVNMGQTYSRVPLAVSTVPPPPPSRGSSVTRADTSAKFKFKRVFGGGLKTSEEVLATASHLFGRNGKGKERDRGESSAPMGAKQRTLQLASNVFSGRKQSLSPTTPTSPGLPPPPPPKRDVLQFLNKPLPSNSDPSEQWLEHERIPGLQYRAQERPDDLRKSDFSVNHHTPRPRSNSGMGSSTPRPVSMAESLQSNHTIVPVNKRLSAVFTEPQFSMAEEDDGDSSQEPSTPVTARDRSSPAPSLRSRNRRSLSLSVGPKSVSIDRAVVSPSLPVSALETDLKLSSMDITPRNMSDEAPVSPSITRETPTLTRTAANGIIIPSNSGSSGQSTGSQIRGRLVALNAASDMSSPPSDGRPLPSIPPTYNVRPSAQGSSGFRKTTISITNGLAPAAGLAKRAVEKMGRAWGGISSSSSNSGYSSSTSSRTSPPSFTSASSDGLSRIGSHLSPVTHQIKLSKGKTRRTPDAHSGTWSTSSSTSSSVQDSDAFATPAGPVLGKCVRGPISTRAVTGAASGGMLFGRDLRSAVRDTAVDVMDDSSSSYSMPEHDNIDLKALEGRRLPALVVRCAQHLLLWGVQEEGLFRVSGRPSHTTKLRAAFDSGADYNMANCSPGEIDPHAVASVFKAYLRELPEPLLTHALGQYFEAAVSTETDSMKTRDTPQVTRATNGLPSNPKDISSLRKPPSLSTLAMPNFSGMRPPSDSLLNALSALLTQLPQENRDMIRTVTELIRVTAKNHKHTKMPLSNLILVFCPSLNMSPPLLRVLCGAEGIWDRAEEPIRLEAMHEDETLGTETHLHTVEVECSSEQELAGEEPIPRDSEETVMSAGDHQRCNQPVGDQNALSDLSGQTIHQSRDPVSTVYLDAEDFTAPVSSNHIAGGPTSLEMDFLNDEGESTLEGQSITSLGLDARASTSPDEPTPSSSAESLATPSSSPGIPLFPPTSSVALKKPPFEFSQSPLFTEPIEFPTHGSLPSTPNKRRKSIPFLRPPDSPLDGPTSGMLARSMRMKKPSLQLLFSKRSASPFSRTVTTDPALGFLPRSPDLSYSPSSDSSASTPVSAVTAPQSTTSIHAPMLDTPIESPGLGLGVGMYDESGDDKRQTIIAQKPALAPLNPTLASIASESSTSLVTGGTPIADLYRTPASSLSVVDFHPLRTRSSKASIASSGLSSHSRIDLSLAGEDGQDDDWTQSVLMAADVDNWRPDSDKHE